MNAPLPTDPAPARPSESICQVSGPPTDYVDLFLQQRAQILTVWTLFGTACTGILGFTALTKGSFSIPLGLLFAAGFIVLSAGNNLALLAMYGELHRAYEMAEGDRTTRHLQRPIACRLIRAYHIGLTLIVTSAILIRTFYPS